MTDFKLLAEQADQLRTRMQARVPIKGSLSFLDSRGTPHAMGIDVGQEQSMKEPRSHIEGATPSTAIWSFGIVPDPFTPPGRPPISLNRRIPVDDFLPPDTIEWQLDRVYELDAQIEAAKTSQGAAQRDRGRACAELDAAIARNQAELRTSPGRVRQPDQTRPTTSRRRRRRPRPAGNADEADAARDARPPRCTRRRSPSR